AYTARARPSSRSVAIRRAAGSPPFPYTTLFRSGLIAAGLYPSPVGIAHFVTSTTHKTLRGPRGGLILADIEHEKLVNSAVFPGLDRKSTRLNSSHASISYAVLRLAKICMCGLPT